MPGPRLLSICTSRPQLPARESVNEAIARSHHVVRSTTVRARHSRALWLLRPSHSRPSCPRTPRSAPQFRTAPRSLISQRIDRSQVTPIPGALPASLASLTDVGQAQSTLPMEHIQLAPSPPRRAPGCLRRRGRSSPHSRQPQLSPLAHSSHRRLRVRPLRSRRRHPHRLPRVRRLYRQLRLPQRHTHRLHRHRRAGRAHLPDPDPPRPDSRRRPPLRRRPARLDPHGARPGHRRLRLAQQRPSAPAPASQAARPRSKRQQPCSQARSLFRRTPRPSTAAPTTTSARRISTPSTTRIPSSPPPLPSTAPARPLRSLKRATLTLATSPPSAPPSTSCPTRQR